MTPLSIALAVTAVLFCSAFVNGQARNALSNNVLETLKDATTFELLSLSGEPDPKGWRGYKLLGKTAVDAKGRTALVEALQNGISRSTGPGARCFVPRHGIHATRGSSSVDLLICFECSWVRVFEGTETTPQVAVTAADPQAVFDAVLRNARVPRP